MLEIPVTKILFSEIKESLKGLVEPFIRNHEILLKMGKIRNTINVTLFHIILGTFIYTPLTGQIAYTPSQDSIAGHSAYYDADHYVLSWYKPETQGAGYDRVIQLASEFMIEGVPIEPRTGQKLYFVTCCFQGPHMQDNAEAINGILPEDWMHNPACVFAGSVHSLALGYRIYTGDETYLDIVREMLDYQLENGTTPAGWEWEGVPYASADPFELIYQGATRWEADGMRGDGLHGIEPDKVGELGFGYLLFFEITEEKKYLEAAIHCADELSKHVRDVLNDDSPFALTNTGKSPWPFRLNARTGRILDNYCSNVIEPIKLFDELIRIQNRIHLSAEKKNNYIHARKLAWDWLFSRNGPIISGIWNGYFEDIPNDPTEANRVQITPMETAKYLIRHPEWDPNIRKNVPALIHWVNAAFQTEGMDAIKEQTWCYEPMGSHTARYGSTCAMWYELSGDPWFKDQARRYLNLATYMTDENGVVRVGPNWPGSWFSDGYGDYIRHFIDALGAIPEWVPADTDHLVRSSSVIQKIRYSSDEIEYQTYDSFSREVLRMSAKPSLIKVDEVELQKSNTKGNVGWSWEKLDKGGVLRIYRDQGKKVSIFK